MTIFKAPSITTVIDCSETFTIMDNCNKIAVDPTLSTKMSSSQTSLSSSNSNEDGYVSSLKVTESCNEKNTSPLTPQPSGTEVGNDVLPIEVDESEGDAIYKLIVNEHEPPPTPQKIWRRTSFLEGDTDNVANFIDIRKIIGKNESNYYYSESNLSSRKKIEKIKITKRQKRRATIDNLEESVHSRMHLLRHCIRASAYQGPTPIKKDGSSIRSIIKKKNIRSTCETIDSTHSSTIRSSVASQDSRCKGNVTFSHIDIREYERIPGDNPCVRAGVPLSIGWAHYQHKSILLDDYETAKGPPRDKIEMMIPASVRRSMLRDEFGASMNELNASLKSVNISKRQRAHTLASENVEVLHEVLESAKRKFKRVVGKAVSTKKQAEELWEASHDAAMAEYLEKNSGHCLKAREAGGELLELDVSHISCDESYDTIQSLEEISPSRSSV